jgi:hypothetical protein
VAAILIYATSDDLAAWTGSTAPDNAATLLRTASLIVRRATMTATYAVDETGAPTDADVLDAFRDATCAQAAAMAANDVDPLAASAGAAGEIASSSIGSASISFATDASTSALTRSLLSAVTDEAAMILSRAGLTAQPVYVGRTGP